MTFSKLCTVLAVILITHAENPNPVLKLVPSTSTPEVYDDVQLQCIVTKAEMLNGNVTFKFGNDTIVVMEQNDTACSTSFVKNADLYRPQCSPKTYFRESRTKTYELSLPSFPPTAFGLWRCEFVPDCEGDEVRSNTVELKQTTVISLELTADTLSAHLNQTVKLTCTVKPAHRLKARIMFKRSDGNVSTTCGSVDQLPEFCSSKTGFPGYQTFCGHGTDIFSSRVKVYILSIKAMQDRDFTEWWCQTGYHKQNYTTITLVNAGILHMVLSADPIESQLKQQVQLKCTVHPAENLRAVILIVRRLGQLNETCGQLYQDLHQCGNATAKPGYNTACGIGSNKNTSERKEYSLQITGMASEDFTQWWCTTRGVAHLHNTIVLRERINATRNDSLSTATSSYDNSTRYSAISETLKSNLSTYGPIAIIAFVVVLPGILIMVWVATKVSEGRTEKKLEKETTKRADKERDDNSPFTSLF